MLVRLDNVDVRIAGTTILRGIDWRLEPGACWGVIGANGSGKSTFLALIAGQLWPAPGRGTRIYDFGRGAERDAVEARRAVTLVGHELQDRFTRLGWNFRVEDIVLSGAARTDIPRRNPAAADRNRVGALLAELDLDHLASRRFLELSRGEQRRVLIARALAFQPRILLLDEPASGLDAGARADLNALIAHAAATTTIVCSAHEARDLPDVVSDVLVLAEGAVAARGPRPRFALAPDASVERGAQIVESRSSSSEPALVEVEHADVWLGGRRILEDVCWRLGSGEQWLIRGRNGAGKSTFLKLLHGQLRPARGGTLRWPALARGVAVEAAPTEVVTDASRGSGHDSCGSGHDSCGSGHDSCGSGFSRDSWPNVWRLRRSIGYVSAELQAEYRYAATVRECIASGLDSSIGLTRRLTAEEEDVTRDLLERFALAALAARPLTTLSYGQMHRVLLARTLVNRPRLLLLDEPWQGLDAATRALVRRELEASMRNGLQVVCVSHTGTPSLDYTNVAEIATGRLEACALTRADAGGEPPENSANGRQQARDCLAR
jgi:molybdate transport system ATP-binding protein